MRFRIIAQWEALEARRLLSAGGQDEAVCILPPVDPKLARAGDSIVIPPEQVAPYPLGDTFLLHSRPGATKVIFLDFDGSTTVSPYWNSGNPVVTPAYSIDADPAISDSEKESIQRIWQRTVEDFSPFDVDVTTQDPGLEALRNTGGGDTQWGIHVDIGGDGAWYAPAGGVAYIGSFTWDSDTPCFVFEDQLLNGDEKDTCEAISHEVGHSLGLSHDGRITPAESYYGGHGSGETGWAPIMGVGYYENLSQWSKGEYLSANQTQDDLAIITSQNGFGYRPDDVGNTVGAATTLPVSGTSITGSGLIETRTDVDMFSFTLASGNDLTIHVDPFYIGPDLDIQANLYDASGTLLTSSNPPDALAATMTVSLTAGTYYLRVDGVGKGDPLGTGYTDYGSLGQYTISSTAATAPLNDLFANRFALTGNSDSAMGTNVASGSESGEPIHAGDAGGRSVWWTWTAPSSSSYILSTAGSSFDTLLGIYTGGSVGGLTPVASNNDESSPTIKTSRIAFDAVAGTTYQIAVDGFNGAKGNIALAISRALHAISGNVYADRNSNSARDPGEPGVAGQSVYLDQNNNGIFEPLGATSWNSTDIPKFIPDNTTVNSTLTVSGLAAIADVNVTLNITHTWDADLDVYLISPTGTSVRLFGDVGSSGDNFTNTTFDDEAATLITSGSAPFAGTYRPEMPLSALDGQTPNGTWTLRTTDSFTADQGNLLSWSITITAGETYVTTDANGDYTFANLLSGSYNLREAANSNWMQTSPTPALPLIVGVSLGNNASASSIGDFPLAFTGTGSDDAYILSSFGAGGSTLQISETLGVSSPVLYSIPKTTLATHPLTLDCVGGNDTVAVVGSPSSDTPIFSTTAIDLGGGAIVNTSNIETRTFLGNGGGDGLTLNGGSVALAGPHILSALTVNAGTLDQRDHNLAIDYADPDPSPIGSWTGAIYTGITGLIQSGELMTSSATGILTTLGIAEASQVLGPTGGTFAGGSVDGSAVLVKFTYAGDANLDGKINIDDYIKIDTGISAAITGWSNGDFNYDGKINIDDYTIIDNNLPTQGPPMANASSIDPIAAPKLIWTNVARAKSKDLLET